MSFFSLPCISRPTALRRGLVFAIAVLAIVAIRPSAADAATVVGQTAPPEGTCPAGWLALQHSVIAPPEYVVPANGVITSVFTRAARPSSAPNPARFEVKLLTPGELTPPGDGHTYTVAAGSGQLEATASSGVEHHATRIPAGAGQVLGLYPIDQLECLSFAATGNRMAMFSGPNPGVGQTLTAGIAEPPRMRLNLGAVLEPDVDGDGYGDESQDSCPGDPTIHDGPCAIDLELKAQLDKPKVGLGGRVVLTLSVRNVPGYTAAAGIELDLALPAGVRVVSAQPDGCTNTAPVGCSIATLNPGQATAAAFVLEGETPGMKQVEASVSSDGTEATPSDNSVARTFEVDSLPAVDPESFRLGKLKRKPRKGTARLAVWVPGAGKVALAKSRKVRRAAVDAGRPGWVKLKIVPSRRAGQRLARRGRLKAAAKVTYAPALEGPATKLKRVKLIRRR